MGSSEQIARIASRSRNILLIGLEEKAGYMNTVTTKWVDVPRACEYFEFLKILSEMGGEIICRKWE